MKVITRVFNILAASMLLFCIGWQIQPVRALELAQVSPVISGSTGVPGTTLSYFDGVAKTATADGNGNYSFSVSSGFAGTVTPSKTGYVVVFTPASIDYSSTPVTSDQTSQNYVPDTSWWSVSGSTGLAGVTLSYNDGSPQTVTSDGGGTYTLLVPDNFAGTITPSLTGYTFTPASIDYSSTPITANLTAQDYAATPITYTISGNAGVAGATLSYTDGTPKTATADGNGDYSFAVSYNWPGTVTPSKTGYTFTPASIDYSSTPVLANLTAQNYAATPITYTISGNAGVAGATLSYTDGTPKTATADGNGDYSFAVSYNWPGTVTPSMTGYTFTPASIDYSSTPVSANLTGQNYTANAITYTISGNAGVAGATLSYTDGTPKTATADGSGNYSFAVSYNWAGIVTPSKTGYSFSPTSKDYSSTPVLANLTDQNYTATPIKYTITGNAGVAGGVLRYTDGTAKTATANGSGVYSFTVSYGWSGTVTPTKTTNTLWYSFSPASRNYTNVLSNKTAQNYTATSHKAAPTAIAPKGNTSDPTPTYKWSRITAATKYEYQLLKGTTLVYKKTVLASACTVGPCTNTPPNVLSDGVYKWSVRAYIGGAWRAYSPFTSFTVLTIPTPLAPNGSSNDTTPTYSWTKITGATQYEYQLFKGASMVYTKTISATACTTTCTHTPADVLSYAAYTWKVRAKVGGVWRPFSVIKNYLVAQPLLNGNFESGPTGWAEYSTHGWSIITTSFPGSLPPHSGAWAVWLGGDYNDISFIQQQVSVTSAAPYLAYWHWIASADLCGYDYGGVLVNGISVESYSLCSSANTGQWVKRTLNLSSYAGQLITLQFRVETDNTLNSNMFIDDVGFQSTAASVPGNTTILNLDPSALAQGKAGLLPQTTAPEGLMLTTQQRIFIPLSKPK